MDEAFLVGVLESGRGLGDIFDGGREGERTVAVEEVLERLAFDIFHHEIRHIVVAGDVEDAHDVGVVERCDRAGLALKAHAREFLIFVLTRHQYLDGDFAMKRDVFRQVHRPHAAAAEHVLHRVRPDAKSLVAPGQ